MTTEKELRDLYKIPEETLKLFDLQYIYVKHKPEHYTKGCYLAQGQYVKSDTLKLLTGYMIFGNDLMGGINGYEYERDCKDLIKSLGITRAWYVDKSSVIIPINLKDFDDLV